MEQKKPINSVVAGLLIGVAIILFSMIIQFMGLQENRLLGFIPYAILVGGLIFLINLYGKAHNYTIGFGGLFGYGFKASALVALLLAFFLLIFFSVFPEFKEKIIEASRTAMEDQNKLTDSEIDKQIAMFSKNFLVFMVAISIFFYLLVGCIGSLIGAAITKKNPYNPLDQLNP